MHRQSTIWFLSHCLCLLLLAGAAGASEEPSGQNTGQDRLQKARQSQNRSETRQRAVRLQDRRPPAAPRSGPNRYNPGPTAWVRVAADYNNDGRFDSIETLYYDDLLRAQQASRRRAMRQAQDFLQNDPRRNRPVRRRAVTITGQLQALRKEQLAGTQQPCIVARVETSSGRIAKVCLGPESQLFELELNEGDHIEISGVRGRINDKTVLFARHVRSGENQVSLDMPSSRNLKRVRGTILRTRSARFRGRDEAYLLANIRLVSGREVLVNLGPQSRVGPLNLQEGDDLSILVRPGRVNRQSAMIAEQIRAKGTLVELPRRQNAESSRRRQNPPRRRQQP